jgi:hypothetical protein
MKAQAWNIYRPQDSFESLVLVDTVFFDCDCTRDYVLDSLINHDDYPPDIIIKRVK